jgi:hypothetical protein
MKGLNKIKFLLALLFLVPAFAFAQPNTQTPGVIVNSPSPTPTGGTMSGIAYECNRGFPGDCTFDDLIIATQRILKWFTEFALGFSIVIFAYGGFLYMQSGDNPGKRKEANTMLKRVGIGIFFIIAAWTIVTFITNALLKPGIDTLLKP